MKKNIKSRLRTELNANELQAIENLIKGYKELEIGLNNAVSEQTKLTRKNTKLRKEKFDLEKKLQDKTYKFLCDNPYIDTFDIREVIMLEQVQKDYIQKSKVRDLIQDIDETIYITKDDEVKFYMLGFKNSINELLQEGDK